MNAIDLCAVHSCTTPTSAVLHARGVFAPLVGRLAGIRLPPDDHHELQEELDALVDAYADTLQAFDGYADPGEHEALQEQVKDLRVDLEKAEEAAEVLEQKLTELVQAASDTPDELQSKYTTALARQVQHDEEIARMKAKVDSAVASVEVYRRERAQAADQALKAETRMASWSQDRTAAETADHYREKYDQNLQEFTDYAGLVRKAVAAGREVAGRSKIAREVIETIARVLR